MKKTLEQTKVNKKLLPTTEEFNILEAALQPLAECLKFCNVISSSNQVNIHKVASHVQKLENFLSKFDSEYHSLGQTFAQELAKQLQEETSFKDCGLIHQPIAFAHFLNPCAKGCLLKQFGSYIDTILKLKKNLQMKLNPLEPNEESPEHPYQNNEGLDSSGN